jgi:quercetin dioxygenase-like cupin family protein
MHFDYRGGPIDAAEAGRHAPAGGGLPRCRSVRTTIEEESATMRIARASDGSYEQGDAGRFTGQVSLSPGLRAPGGIGMTVVHFSAGARTHWHAHPGGQLLFGVSGRGRVRSRGEPAQLLVPGDIIAVEPGEWHYHGAEHDSPMAHVSVSIAGPPEWGDPVTEDEYAEGPPR